MSNKTEKLLESMSKQLEQVIQLSQANERNIEQLTRIVGETNKKVSEHNERFDRNDENFKEINERIQLLETIVLSHEERFDHIDQMLKKQDERLNKQDALLEKLTEITLKTQDDVQTIKDSGTRLNHLEIQTDKNETDILLLKKIILNQ